MRRPIVIAHHLIWTAYGWWLPNDPRGSMSKTIASDVIADLGQLHHGRKKVQPSSVIIRRYYRQAESLLKFPLLSLSTRESQAIADPFSAAVDQHRYTCYACAIMPDHVHVLIRKHRHKAEEMIRNLQQTAKQALRDLGLRRGDHPVWGGPGWKVFLDSPEEVRRTIKYIEGNPLKHGLPPQRWQFVKDYDDWPLHPGHSPNSPYARRMREQM